MKFTADAVLELAERIEANAAEFYSKAADLHAASTDVRFLRDLARMELDHERQFAEMRRQLPDSLQPSPADFPYLVASLQLDSMAGAHGGEGRLSNADPLTPHDSLSKLVRCGLSGEERTIVFYADLRRLVGAEPVGRKIDQIIAQERNHAAVLAGKLAELESTRPTT